MPEEWLASKIVLLYQKEDQANPRNYRPVAVSNTMYTVMMRIVMRRIRATMLGNVKEVKEYGCIMRKQPHNRPKDFMKLWPHKRGTWHCLM